MADLAAFLSVSHSNSFYFTNACNNDMLLYPESSSQSIHIGTMSNSASVLQITSTAVNVIGDLNFTGALKANGGSYQWSNNSSNLFVMGSNVAIGRSNTTRALHVVGDVEFGSNIYMAQQPLFRGIRVMPFSNTPILNIASAVTAVQGYSNDANGVNLLLPSALGSSYLRVLAGATELARLTGNGLLGIGTSQPSSALHLYSNAAVGITLCNPATGAMPAYVGLSNSGELLLSCGSNLSAVFQTSNVERMRIDGNGYVGIGTPQPTSALHLASNAAAPVSITLCNAATGGRPAAITLSNTGDLALSCASNSSIAFQTSNAERMRIGSNGYVGIGTSLPTSALHLASNAFAAVGMTLCNFATGAMPASIVLSNSGDLLVSCGSNYSVAFQTSNIERLRINSNGNVGIGTPFPTSALHLASNAAASVMVTLCNAATGGMPALIGISNSGEAVFACTSNLGMSFQTNNIERLRINSNGNVGIGTPFPTSALHLASNALANVMVTLCNTATGAMPARFGLSNSGEFVVACTSNLGMSFQTNNVERIRVTSNGNVGIGHPSPLESLAVVGSMSLSNTSSRVVLASVSNAIVTQSGLSEKPALGQTITGSQNSFTVTTPEGNVILSTSGNYQGQNIYTVGTMYSGGNPWVSTIVSYNTGYPYTFSSTGINTPGMGYGHWMQVQIPVGSVLRSLYLNGSTLYSFGIGGSTDGTNFTLLQSWYNLMSPNRLFTITSANTTAYTYYRLVVFAANDGGNRAAWIQSFRLFFATQTLTIPGNVGLSNAYGFAELSSSSSNVVANSMVAGALTTGTITSVGSITTMSGYIGDAGFWSWGALYQSNGNLVPLPANSVGVLSAYINYAGAQGLWWVQYINGSAVITLIQKSGGENGNLMELRYSSSYLEYFNSTGGSSGPASGRTGAWAYTRFM